MSTFEPRPIKVPFALRAHEQAFLADLLPRVQSDETGRAWLYSSPTGSGKSTMFLAALARDPFGWGLTPRLEIVAGMLAKMGEKVDGLSEQKLADLAFEYRISTPVRFRNLLAKGLLPFTPWRLYIDEAHHDVASTYADIRAYLPSVTRVGLTATPFRGTARSTQDFLKLWDEHIQVLNIPQAAQLGLIEIPEVEIWPLVDDDAIDITNGEFTTRSAGEVGISRAADLVQRVQASGWVRGDAWDRPTLFAVSSTNQAHDLVERLTAAGIPASAVVQDTTRQERERIFRACLARETAIVQINVVSEGVDLAIRRIIDMRPTFSPVYWVQLVGRATRPRRSPMDPRSQYVCCNRNLERHAYLMEGLVPSSKVAESQKQMGGASNRTGARAVGLSTEGVGRFAASPVTFADGTTGAVYNLYTMDGFKKKELAVLLHPCYPTPLYAERETTRDDKGEKTYGRWQRIGSLPDLEGYASSPAGTLTEKQRERWERDAGRYGLDASKTPTRRSIQAFFLLRDLGLRVRA